MSGILSPDLLAKLGKRGGGVLVLPSRKKKRARKEKSGDEANEQQMTRKERRWTKGQQKKVDRLAKDKLMATKRHEVLDSLQKHAISAEELTVLRRSGELGQKDTARKKVTRAHRLRRLGITEEGWGDEEDEEVEGFDEEDVEEEEDSFFGGEMPRIQNRATKGSGDAALERLEALRARNAALAAQGKTAVPTPAINASSRSVLKLPGRKLLGEEQDNENDEEEEEEEDETYWPTLPADREWSKEEVEEAMKKLATKSSKDDKMLTEKAEEEDDGEKVELDEATFLQILASKFEEDNSGYGVDFTGLLDEEDSVEGGEEDSFEGGEILEGGKIPPKTLPAPKPTKKTPPEPKGFSLDLDAPLAAVSKAAKATERRRNAKTKKLLEQLERGKAPKDDEEEDEEEEEEKLSKDSDSEEEKEKDEFVLDEDEEEETTMVLESTDNVGSLPGVIVRGGKPKKAELERKRVVLVDRNESIQLARMQLPVCGMEQEIMEAVSENDVVIISGETGSGKTTQVPQFLYEAGYGRGDRKGWIGVTQPRRVAAVAMCDRVGIELGQGRREVGYQVRFDSTSMSKSTIVKFMTDGILLREAQSDLLLRNYSCIVIDEAHERNLNTDVLLGLLSRAVPLRKRLRSHPPLKLIIMSATLRLEDFRSNRNLFPIPPPVLHVGGRQHPVTVHFSKRTAMDEFVQAAANKAIQIHRKLPHGGILVFVTGKREVELACRIIRERLGLISQRKLAITTKQKALEEIKGLEEEVEQDVDETPDSSSSLVHVRPESDTDEDDEDEQEKQKEPHHQKTSSDSEEETESPVRILPLYAMLPKHLQERVFAPVPEGVRQIVIATNVAETSLTIPGIRYVVDCGRVKRRVYDPKSGSSRMETGWISRASADQRAGRAGRTGPGHCYRLYSTAVYGSRLELHEEPEVARLPVESTVLRLKALGIGDVASFPFPTPPPAASLREAESRLKMLGAISSDGEITVLGKRMAEIPLAPHLSKIAALGGAQDERMGLLSLLLVASMAMDQLLVPPREAAEPLAAWEAAAKEDEFSVVGDGGDAGEERGKGSVTGKAYLEHARFRHPESDGLTQMRVVGAFMRECVDPRWRVHSEKATKFADSHFARRAGLVEAAELVRQLVEQARGTRAEVDWTQIRAPSLDEDVRLMQVLVAGLIHQAMRRLSRAEARDLGIPFAVDANPNRVPYLPAMSHVGAPLFVHSDSVVCAAANGADAMPRYAVFLDAIDIRSRRCVRNVTALRKSWIAPLAASTGLVSLDPPQFEPEPKYDRDHDAMYALHTPRFGDARWELPPRFEPIRDQATATRWFARRLLEGQILPSFTSLKLALSPTLLSKRAPQKKVLHLLSALSGISTLNQLLQRWKTKPNFLRPEIQSWLRTPLSDSDWQQLTTI